MKKADEQKCECECGCREVATTIDESVALCDDCSEYTVDESGDCHCSREPEPEVEQGEITRQVGGAWRHLYHHLHGDVAIDEYDDGVRDVTCFGGVSRDDLKVVIGIHMSLMDGED